MTYYWLRTHNPMADKFNALIQSGMDLEWKRERYAYACALFFYDSHGTYSHITQGIKYRGDLATGRLLGRMLGNRMALGEHWRDVSMVIPVPLHWRRRWERGYNQAEIIASEVALRLGTSLREDVLERTKYTRTQTKLNVGQKVENVEMAFRARGLEGMTEGHVLLVDDVFTTGATLHACYRALRTALPVSVRISVATLGFVGR